GCVPSTALPQRRPAGPRPRGRPRQSRPLATPRAAPDLAGTAPAAEGRRQRGAGAPRRGGLHCERWSRWEIGPRALCGAAVHRRVSEPTLPAAIVRTGAAPSAAVSSGSMASPTTRRTVMSRRRFLEQTDQLIADGEALVATPHWDLFRAWLLNSDELLERVWGRMDRYHLAWLNVGRDSAPSGSDLGDAGTA